MGNTQYSRTFEDDEAQTRTVRLAILGIGVLLCCGLSFFGAMQYQASAIDLYNQYFPSSTPTFTKTPTLTPSKTPTPTLTPTETPTPTATVPHVLISPSAHEAVLEETFDGNQRQWRSYYRGDTVKIESGELFLKPSNPEYVAAAICSDCPSFNQSFYFQGELGIASDAFSRYGLIFCAQPSRPGYYVFTIDSKTQNYQLLQLSEGNWINLLPSTYVGTINKFPKSNTLAVQFDQGRFDLYINGELVNTHTTTEPLSCNQIGFFVDGGDVGVTADNLFAYEVENSNTSTPTP
jgi:hypothetical protein